VRYGATEIERRIKKIPNWQEEMRSYIDALIKKVDGR